MSAPLCITMHWITGSYCFQQQHLTGSRNFTLRFAAQFGFIASSKNGLNRIIVPSYCFTFMQNRVVRRETKVRHWLFLQYNADNLSPCVWTDLSPGRGRQDGFLSTEMSLSLFAPRSRCTSADSTPCIPLLSYSIDKQ